MGYFKGLLAFLFLAFLMAQDACTPKKEPQTALALQQEPALVGKATWYGKKFHGRKTASGERFDMHALTAAHRTLPFGTQLEVTNPTNQKTILVTINDRGPFVKGVILDLSFAAAKELDFIRQGRALVTAHILHQPSQKGPL